MLEMWPQSFCATECEESNRSKQPCRLARPDYVYSGAVSFSLHMNLSYCVRATEEKNFIYKWRGTYYSFSYNLALGISKILTLRLALRLFGKSSNNGTTVYGSGYLRPNELLHVHHVGKGQGSRGEGRGRVRTTTSVSIWTRYGAKCVNLHSKIRLYTSVFGVCTSSSYWNLLKDIYIPKNMIISLTKVVGTRIKWRE